MFDRAFNVEKRWRFDSLRIIPNAKKSRKSNTKIYKTVSTISDIKKSNRYHTMLNFEIKIGMKIQYN